MNINDILLPPTVIILLLVVLPPIIIIYHIQYHVHEYGHVLELKKAIYKDIDNYKKETKTDKISIQVIKFIGCDKKKTYSDYFQYLENKKQEFKYQSIIKDIADGGYLFSKQIIVYKYLWITYFVIWVIISIFTMFNPYYNYIYVLINLYVICMISIYLYTSETGYGSNKTNSKRRGDSDHYIYRHPKDFKYITLKEDKENLQKEYKIILDIVVDLSDAENPKINTISKNKFYKLLTKIYPIDD